MEVDPKQLRGAFFASMKVRLDLPIELFASVGRPKPSSEPSLCS